MNSKVIIKSIPNGIKILLDNEVTFSDILEEIGKKFRDSANFFRGNQLAVSFEGRNLTEVEEQTLIETIENNGELSILYVISASEEQKTTQARVLNNVINNTSKDNSSTNIYKGSVYKNENLSFDGNVIILGDIDPQASVTAHGNVIVLGGIYGNITIDTDFVNEVFIFGLEIAPERLKINSLRFYPETKSKWSIRPKYQGKIASVINDKIIISEVNKNTFSKLFKG